ncbi:hypothetical protein N2152v2_006659, partial [Parachlorella kessleri]
MTASSVPVVELLDVDNYATWRSKMKFLLITKGLWAAVVGDSIDRDKDAKALALIGLHVKDLHLPVLERCTTAKGAWEQLEAVYQAKSNARKRQLRKELSQLRMGAAEPLAKYVARAKEIQNQLRAAGYEVAHQEVAWALLAGLPQAYETVVTVLETSSTEDVKLDDILPKLMSVEQRMCVIKSPGLGEAALAAANKRSNDKQRTCYACGKQILVGLAGQHGHLLQGLATPFSQSVWPRVHSLRFALHEGDAAVDACQAAVQAQGLEVQLDGRTITVPVQPVAARVPPGHATLEMRGVPDDCARHGFTAAVLAAAGYGPGSGVRVVHERAGLARGPTGETLPFPRLDMVVATVTVPQADRSLCRLPLAVEVGGAHLTFAVQHWLSPPVVRLASVPSARESPAPPRAAVLDRVGAAHGLTAQVRATGRAPIAEVAAQRAQPPGSRVGLGFPRPASVRAPLPPPDAPMTDALPTPPPPTVPLDEPIFGAATSYMQEHSDLQPEEIERVVLAFKTRHPTQYTASLGASTASSLPQAVRGPLHTLARVWFGERGGVSTPPGIVAIWEDVLPGEEGGAPAVLDRLGSAGGSLSRPTTSTSAATSAAPDLHSACRDGGQPSAQPTPMAIEGGCLHSPGPGGPPAPVMAQPQHAPQPASAPLRLLSLNVNGLREPAKRRTLFGEFQRGRWDVLCLQEAHTVSAQEVATWAQEGAGMGMPLRVGCFANALTSQSCGVVTLVKDTAPLTASRLATAPGGGRLLDVVLMYAGMELSVVNCYAPCSHEDRPAFFTEALAAALPPDRPVLACGDWNFVPGEADVVGVLGAGSHRQVGALQFEEVQVGHGLVDAWRHLHPDGPGVTHVAANGTGSSAARLDRWYVAAPLLPWVRACDIVHGLPGDHLGVELVLQPPVTLPCGKGRWRLPLHLLQDKVYCTGVVDRVRGFLAAHPLQAGYDARQRWEGLKACLTQFSMAHTLHARAGATQQRRQLLQSVQAAQRAYSAHPTVPGLLHAYTAAQQRLQQHEAAAAGKRAAAASVLWHCYGEQPTKWFHSLGRKVMLHQPIPAVFDPLDREAPAADMSSPAGIATALQHASSFFSADSAGGLFRPVPTDPAAQAQLLEAVDKQLSEASAKRTLGPKEDGSLTTGEVEKVFPALPRGVSPGLDGLPYEFYLHFWGTLAEPFLAMANEALREGEGVEQQPDTPVLPRSMLVGLIVLIHKGGGKEARDLASYRPITLLNCDYRLLARVLCSRLAGPLGSVVDATQTAFLPGRWIGDNVLYHLEEVQYLLEADGMEGCVVLLDFEKAYDRVVRGWIYQVMQRMAFPEPAVRWVRIMLAGTVARVSLNGHYT